LRIKKENYQNIISVLIIGFTGSVYMFKYSAIYLKAPALLASVFFVVFLALIIGFDKLQLQKFPFISRKFFLYLSVLIIFISICWITFLPRFGQIGRFPAIIDWLDRLFSGRFPYSFPITPSGFPFLFILAMPFYFIGNVGYLEACGLILFLILTYYYSGSTKEMLLRILMLLLCPVLYYGFVVRDELFFNIMLPVLVIFLSDKYLDPVKINFKFILFGLLFGLALSTRSVVGVIYAVYLIHLFRKNIVNGIIFIIILSAIFGLLLLPFYLWDPHSFISCGPFAIQSYLSHMPLWIEIATVGLAVYMGWRAANINDVLFSSGILLFLLVFLSMFFQISSAGFINAVIHDVFDISYFVFCIPLLILSIKENKNVLIL
jgi:hypothetical protein